MSFEDALKALEEIVRRLESGDESLDDAIRLYAEGDKLRAQCEERLRDAQMRVSAITLSRTGTPTGTQPFDVE